MKPLYPRSRNLVPVCLIWILLQSVSANSHSCENDDFCIATFGTSYYCSPENKCNRLPLLPPEDIFTVLGCLVLFLFNVLSFALGTSANGLAFPMMVLGFAFIAQDTISIIKTANIVSTFVNVVFVFMMRNPDNGNKTYINFNLLVFLIPLCIVGSMIGILLFNFLPGIMAYIFVFSAMLYLTVRNYYRYRKSNAKPSVKPHEINEMSDSVDSVDQGKLSRLEFGKLGELADPQTQTVKAMVIEMDSRKQSGKQGAFGIPPQTKTPAQSVLHTKKRHFTEKHRRTQSLVPLDGQKSVCSKLRENTIGLPYPSAFSILLREYKPILLIILTYSLMVLGNLVKGSQENLSILGATDTPVLPYCLYTMSIASILCIAYIGLKMLESDNKPQVTEHPSTAQAGYPMTLIFKIGLISIIGGFITSNGVCGTLFIATSMMALNVEPIIVKSTMSILVFCMSANNGFQFIYMGYFDAVNIAALIVINLSGCLVGNLIIKRALRKNVGAANSIIDLCSLVMTFCICVALPFSSYYEYLHNAIFLDFGTFG